MASSTEPFFLAPAPFTATEISLNGKRAIRLLLQDFRRAPKVINLIVEQELPGFTRFPASYEFVDMPVESFFDPRGPRQTAIRIIAAPGVSVDLESWPSVSETLLEVYRVQDPELVPPQATSIISDFYTPAPEINEPPDFSLEAVLVANYMQYPKDYFIVEELPPGLIITHPFSTYALTLDYPRTSSLFAERKDSKTRFCYQVLDETLIVIKTSNVNVTLQGGPPQALADSLLYKPQKYIIPFKIYEAPDILSVPLQGATIILQDGWKDVTEGTTFIPGLIDESSLLLFSVYPAVSELLDVWSLVSACRTGKDFWGRKLTRNEKLLLGLTVVLELVSMTASRLVKIFKRGARLVARLTRAVKSAGITARERIFLKEAERRIRRGIQMTNEQWLAFVNIYKRVKYDAHPPIEVLLNVDGSGFLHTTLQEGYRKYMAGKSTDKLLPPKDWAKANTTGKYSDILVELLGPNFRKATVTAAATSNARMFNILDIMKPLGYGDEKIKENLTYLLAKRAQLEERLKPLFTDLNSADEIVAYMARNQMSTGRFNNVKGIVGELFGFPMQQKILKDRYADAFLFTGVKVKRVGGKRAVLFTDNIIAIRKGNDIEIKVVFEVKAGKRGGDEATSQIFEWIEGRLETGDQLIIPAGSKYYDAQGAEFTLDKAIQANYALNPSPEDAAAGVGVVTGLANAERNILAAKGTSLLGLDSPDQVAAQVDRLDLPLTSSEMDYLSGKLVQSLGQSRLPGAP